MDEKAVGSWLTLILHLKDVSKMMRALAGGTLMSNFPVKGFELNRIFETKQGFEVGCKEDCWRGDVEEMKVSNCSAVFLRLDGSDGIIGFRIAVFRFVHSNSVHLQLLIQEHLVEWPLEFP